VTRSESRGIGELLASQRGSRAAVATEEVGTARVAAARVTVGVEREMAVAVRAAAAAVRGTARMATARVAGEMAGA
jgi:hypothetical protein